MSYSGQASWFDPWDINVYVAAINWGQQQNLLLANNYTTVPHQPILFYPVYTLSGFLLPNLSPYLIFHLLALLFGSALMLTLWFFLKLFFTRYSDKLTALILISLGGGLGWLFFPSVQSPDLFVTGFTFTSQFQRAHEALGIIAYLSSLIFFYFAMQKKNLKINILSAGSLLFLIILYPYYLLSYFIICSIYALLSFLRSGKSQPFIFLLINFLFVLPIFLLYFFNITSNLGFKGVLSQQLKAPGLLELLSGYGLLLPFVIFSLKSIKKDAKCQFLIIWFFSSLILSFLPFGFARFYLRTLFFPLTILVIYSIPSFSQRFKISQNIFLLILVLLTSFSSVFIMYKRLDEVNNNNPWFYLTMQERESMEFLDKQASTQGVLAAYTLGNYIPANTKSKVYFGHMLQTPDVQTKVDNLIKFYANVFSEEEAKKFLEQENIKYIVWGREEEEIAKIYHKTGQSGYLFLKPVFVKGNTTVFEQ